VLACAKSCKSVQAVWYFGIDLDPPQPTPFNNTSCHTLTRTRSGIPCQPTRPSSLITGNALALPPGASTRFSSAPKHTTQTSSGPNTQPKPPKESCTSALRWGRRAAQEPVPSAAEYNRRLAWTKPPFIFKSTPCTVELTAASEGLGQPWSVMISRTHPSPLGVRAMLRSQQHSTRYAYPDQHIFPSRTLTVLKGKHIALPPPRVSRDSRLSHTRTIRKDLRGELMCDYTYS